MANLMRDFGLLGALVAVIAGIAAVLVLRGWLLKLIALAIALLVAAYFIGWLPALPSLLP